MEHILADIERDLERADSTDTLQEMYRMYLGKEGKIKNLFTNISSYSIAERKIRGQELNAILTAAQTLFEEKELRLKQQNFTLLLENDKELLDYRIPKIGHLHPMTETIRMMNKLFIEMGYSVMEGPEIETDEYCLQRLNVPLDHPARDMQDTIYIEEPNILLRSQTSSVEARILETYTPPFKVVIPGKVYRNEKVNKSNHFIFHQYQGVVVLEKVSLKDLFGTFTYLFKKMYGDNVVIRFRSKYYPEVAPGVGPDMQCFHCRGEGCRVCKGVGWIEMGGSGIIHPNVLKMANIDTEKWMGFAFGLGLDRWVMAKYNITDIRSLLGGDIAYPYYRHEATI